jgi:Ras-related protein Rab-18
MFLGIDFKYKYLDNFDGHERIKLTIWDTAGQERFRSLTSSYYRGAQGVILVYDVTRRETFDDLKQIWLRELTVYAEMDELVLMIVGNKIDLEEERKVSTDEGLRFAQDHSALFMESSAKTRAGVNAIFEELTKKVLNAAQSRSKARQEKTTVKIEEELEGEQDFSNESLCSC